MAKRRAIIDDGFNPELIEGATLEGIFQIPRIEEPERIIIPSGFTPWTKRKYATGDNELLEFFEHDTSFAEVLIDPQRYVSDIVSAAAFCPLDCSLYRNAPLSAQIANIYRSRAIGSYYQRKGANVYPLARWGDERTYTTCLFREKIAFTGIPRHSIVVASSYGCYAGRDNKCHFNAGLMSMLDELEPRVVLLHGSIEPGMVAKISNRTELHLYPDWVSRVKGGVSNG